MTHTSSSSVDIDTSVHIAGISTHLQISGPTGPMLTADHLQRRFGPFLRSEPVFAPAQRIALRADWGAWPRDGETLIPSLRITLQDTHVKLDRTDLDATFAETEYTVLGECAPSLLPAEECVRLMLWHRWTDPKHAGALLVHSACVVHRGEAYCFSAHSGTGKSTLARLTPGEQALTDELAILVKTPTGWRAYPSPFWNWDTHTPQGIDPTRSYPLAGLYFLQQAPSTQCTHMGADEAFLRLIEQVFAYRAFTTRSAQTIEYANRLVCDLLAQSPHGVGLLRLVKGEDPFEAIEVLKRGESERS